MPAFEHVLAEPIEHFNRKIERVFLLEPRAKHLAKFGEPQMSVFNGKTGSSYDVDNDDAVAKYLDELLSTDGRAPADGGGKTLFAQLSLADGIAVRDALFGFFVAAKMKIISARSTSSSSAGS
jgi:hypothetical protein